MSLAIVRIMSMRCASDSIRWHRNSDFDTTSCAVKRGMYLRRTWRRESSFVVRVTLLLLTRLTDHLFGQFPIVTPPGQFHIQLPICPLMSSTSINVIVPL
jgi:hypothetical protein